MAGGRDAGTSTTGVEQAWVRLGVGMLGRAPWGGTGLGTAGGRDAGMSNISAMPPRSDDSAVKFNEKSRHTIMQVTHLWGD